MLPMCCCGGLRGPRKNPRAPHLLYINFPYKRHPAADSRCGQFPFVHQLIHILPRTPHKYRRFCKRQVLLLLEINQRFYGIHKILLPLLPRLFCLRLTLLAAKLLHSAPRHELLTTILTLSNCFHFQHTFDGSTYIFSFPTVESTMLHVRHPMSTSSTL